MTPARRVLGALAWAALGAACAGCASLARQTGRSYDVAASGLGAGDQRLRDALAAGRSDDALAAATSVARGAPDDALLRELYVGAAAYYAERWDESGAALERAGAIADDRVTKSASRAALSLVANDFALPYVPGENERMFVHYYAALGRLRRGDAAGAAVEARRLSFLLERSRATGDDPLESDTRAALRYFAGVAFEAAGEHEDAAVAYRNAAALSDAYGRPQRIAGGLRIADVDSRVRGNDVQVGGSFPRTRESTSSIRDRPVTHGVGDVVVVLEQGFVAHRVAEALPIRVSGDGLRALAEAGGGGADDEVASGIATRLLTGSRGVWADELSRDAFLPEDDGGEADGESATVPPWLAALGRRGGPRVRHAERATTPGTVLRVAWPALRRARLAARPAAVFVPRDVAAPALAAFAALGGPAGGVALGSPVADAAETAHVFAGAELSDAVAADFKRDRTKRLARLLVRSAARAVAAEHAGRKYRELGELVAGAGRALERADTRSWHLLPGRVSFARLRLPAGRHTITADVGGERVLLGEVVVRANGLVVAAGRVY